MVYRYEQIVSTYTKDIVSYDDLIAEFEGEAAFIDHMKTEWLPQIPSKIVQGYADQGITVTVVDYHIRNAYLDPSMKRRNEARFILVMDVTIETDAVLQGSPIAPIVIIAIGIAIALIVAAITVPFAFFGWMESMTVKSITSKKYDWVKNPETGEWEWKVVSEETVTEPDPWGMIIVGLIVVAMLLILVFAFRGRGGGKR